jgi:N-acetylmuramoyl-L-alanine amidase
MDIQKLLLTKNMFSRPGKKLERVKGIAIHWVGNAGSSAVANRNYFEILKNQSPNDPAARYASAHFVIGIEGYVVQCLPLDEMAYHVGAKTYSPGAVTAFGHYPNNCTIGIELCHPDDSGKFTKATLDAATELCWTLCGQFNLAQKDIWTHCQITGKNCPKWFVDHPDEFGEFVSHAAPPF